MQQICHLICDTREKLPRSTVRQYHRKIEFKQLTYGDYACACGKVGFERKEDDLDNYQRTTMQCAELRSAYEHAYLIVTRSQHDFLHDSKRNAYSTRIGYLASLTVYLDAPPMFLENYYDALEWMYRVIDKYHDDKIRNLTNFNQVRHIKRKDQQINVLTSFPGIGLKLATDILTTFPSIGDFFVASQKEMMTVPGLGKVKAKKIMELILK